MLDEAVRFTGGVTTCVGNNVYNSLQSDGLLPLSNLRSEINRANVVNDALVGIGCGGGPATGDDALLATDVIGHISLYPESCPDITEDLISLCNDVTALCKNDIADLNDIFVKMCSDCIIHDIYSGCDAYSIEYNEQIALKVLPND